MSHQRPSDCHPDRKHFAKGRCRICYYRHRLEINPRAREVARSYHIRNREKIEAKRRESRRLDPERYKKWARESNRRYPERMRERHLRRMYGITLAEYGRMSSEQGGLCAICKRHHPKLDVDHDHSTGRVRGLLCRDCNYGVGRFKDSQGLLAAAIAYLKVHENALAEVAR